MIDRRKLLLGAVAGVVGTVAAKLAPARTTSTPTLGPGTTTTTTVGSTTTTTTDPNEIRECNCQWYWNAEAEEWWHTGQCVGGTGSIHGYGPMRLLID